ncbi:N66 matrix protein-like, partial [Ruditapes philippinarum]|uniref:N66 matrix protein-like n=1 Tax=Ruditapes philippinarum TaxID=129788 RepID=UPI00295AC759
MRMLVKARNNGRSNLKVVGTRVFESGYTGNKSLGNTGNKNSLGSAGFRNGGAASAGASNDIDGNSYKDQGNGNGAWCGRRGNNRGGNRGNRGGQRQSLDFSDCILPLNKNLVVDTIVKNAMDVLIDEWARSAHCIFSKSGDGRNKLRWR